VRDTILSVPDSDPKERRVIEWLTTSAKGREWRIEPARKTPKDSGDGPVMLLNYYAVRYGYDLVVAS
jgi:hypothetical protein